MESFGDRIKKRRKQKLLSQDDLAEYMGKGHKTVVSAWETGKAEPSLADVRKLAEVLETTVGWLIDGTGEGELPAMQEPPVGYVLMPASEVVDMQRRLIQHQQVEIERQK